MCLAVIAIQALPAWPLIIAANRDEFHVRSARASQPWEDAPDILAGRDLKAGGTWLGMTSQGRIALLTNYREPGRNNPAAPSRGRLVEEYLRGAMSAQDYAAQTQAGGQSYNGFNLMLGDRHGLWFSSNRPPENPTGTSPGQTQKLPIGVMGLSNASLDTPWPKLQRTVQAVSEHLAAATSLRADTPAGPDPATLFRIFRDQTTPADHALPDTGVGLERERMLSSPFILSEGYGTRCTTLLLQRADGQVFFHERTYDPTGQASGQRNWHVDTGRSTISVIKD